MTNRQYKSLANAGYDIVRLNRVPRRKRHSWRVWLAIALAACAWLANTIYSAASAEQEFRQSELGMVVESGK